MFLSSGETNSLKNRLFPRYSLLLYALFIIIWATFGFRLIDVVLEPFPGLFERRDVIHGISATIVLYLLFKHEWDERERLMNASQETEALLGQLVDKTVDAVTLLDKECQIVLFSKGAEEIFGYSPDEIVGQAVDTLLAESIRVQYRALLNQMTTGKRITPQPDNYYQLLCLRNDGTEFYCEATVSMVERDHQTMLLLIMRDVSQRQVAEQEQKRLLDTLQERTNQLATASEVSKSASIILDPDDLITNAVKIIRSHFDFYYVGLFLVDEEGQEANLRAGTGEAGKKMLAAGHQLPIGDQSMIGWAIANQEARIALDVGKDAVRFDNPFLPDTHSEMALPLVTRGHCIGALTVHSEHVEAFSLEDITVLQTMADQLAIALENARLLTTLQQSEARHRLLADNATDMIAEHDAQGVYLYVSPACETLLGYQPKELIGTSCYDLYHPDDLTKIHDMDVEILDDQSVTYTITYRIRHKNGHYIWFETTNRTIPDRDSFTGDGIVSISRDVSQRKQLEMDLRDALETEKELSNLKLRFTTTVSHEFRTPLTVILSSGEILQRYSERLNRRKARSASKPNYQTNRLYARYVRRCHVHESGTILANWTLTHLRLT